MDFEKSTQRFPQLLTDHLWMLGNYFFNLYLVQGEEKSALIEVGVSAVVDRVIGQLAALGISPDYLIVTHPHADHFTGLAGLRDRFPKAVVVAAQGARDFVMHPKAAGSIVAEDRFVSRQLEAQGIKPGRQPLETIDFPEDHLMIAEKQEIDLGGLTLCCFLIKGHSPGNLAVHIPELDALIVSDSLGFHYPGRGFCPLFFTGYKDFLSTLDRLDALKPTIVCPAHQGALQGQQAIDAFEEARRTTMGFHDRITNDFSKDDARTISELFQEFYKDEFRLYSPENIINCMKLLVRRVRESNHE